MNTTVSTTDHVGTIAARHPMATRVFARYDIDFCCGGAVPLGEVCAERGLDPQTLKDEIEQVIAGSTPDGVDWNTAPLTDLIQHIVTRFHRQLDEELPRIEEMSRKVLAVHGQKRPEMLSGILQTFLALQAELQSHMMKEEQILFPMIASGQGAMSDGPVSVMMHEHDSAGAALKRLRELTGDYMVPEEACMTWRALWSALETLEEDMHQHIHLENNILFPRALNS